MIDECEKLPPPNIAKLVSKAKLLLVLPDIGNLLPVVDLPEEISKSLKTGAGTGLWSRQSLDSPDVMNKKLKNVTERAPDKDN